MFKGKNSYKRLICIFNKLFCSFGKASVRNLVNLWFSKD